MDGNWPNTPSVPRWLYCEWGRTKYSNGQKKVPHLLGERARDTRWSGATSRWVLCTAVNHCRGFRGTACSPWREQLSAEVQDPVLFSILQAFILSMAGGFQAKFMFFPKGLLWPLCLDRFITVLQPCNLQDIKCYFAFWRHAHCSREPQSWALCVQHHIMAITSILLFLGKLIRHLQLYRNNLYIYKKIKLSTHSSLFHAIAWNGRWT